VINYDVSAQTPQEERQALEEELRKLEEQLSFIENDISKTEKEKKTLQNEIYLLRKKVESLNVQIQQSNTMIQDIGLQVEDTEGSIEQTSLKMEESKERLSVILRTIYQEDKKSLFEIFLTEESLSDFFGDLMALQALNDKSSELLVNIKKLKFNLEGQKQSLGEEKMDLEKIVKLRIFQRQESSQLKIEQESYLKLTEEQYQKQLKEKSETEKKASVIRARIFQLIGVPDAPTFGEAISVANIVTNQINIRTAFLLAIISQESAMGRNVGQCYVTNKITGAGTYKDGRPLSRLMQAKQDLPIFLEMTGEMFSEIPVSCWIAQCAVRWNGQLYFCGASVDARGDIICAKSGYVPFGFGGAMGPAQFIPRTWNLYKDKVKIYTGKSSSDPWNVRDAFTASALLLFNKGASSEAYWDEYNAASRYYGGSNSYARQVMKRAACIQDFIDNGAMSSDCQDLIF